MQHSALFKEKCRSWLGVRVEESVKDAIKRAAEQDHTHASTLVRRLIQLELKARGLMKV